MGTELETSMITPVKTAVIGCGNVSGIYFKNAASWKILDIVACSSLNMKSAEKQAAKYGIPRVLRVADVLADESIELVLNLTVPAAHAEIGLEVIRSGKHLYNEKPLAIQKEDAQSMLREAEARGLRVGCAPDTFLGGGLQTCRKLLDEGAIGQPITVNAHFLARGPEYWHPNPEFLYKVGAGPLFDMGPYYLTALVSLFGPIRRVTGLALTTFSQRTIRSIPKAGTTFEVETPTNIASVLDFNNGPLATLAVSFDVSDRYLPLIEIFGTEGSLTAPDPNTFAGPVYLRRDEEEVRHEVPLRFGHTENSRCIGLADMAYAIRKGTPHRANGKMAFHILDVMHAILESSNTEKHILLTSTCERPPALPEGYPGRLF
jgi:predicted dehydrogenase